MGHAAGTPSRYKLSDNEIPTTPFHFAGMVWTHQDFLITTSTDNSLPLLILATKRIVSSPLQPNLRSNSRITNSQLRNPKQKWGPTMFHWTTRPSEWEIYSRASTPPILQCPLPPTRHRCLRPNAPLWMTSTLPPSTQTSTWISWYPLILSDRLHTYMCICGARL